MIGIELESVDNTAVGDRSRRRTADEVDLVFRSSVGRPPRPSTTSTVTEERTPYAQPETGAGVREEKTTGVRWGKRRGTYDVSIGWFARVHTPLSHPLMRIESNVLYTDTLQTLSVVSRSHRADC